MAHPRWKANFDNLLRHKLNCRYGSTAAIWACRWTSFFHKPGDYVEGSDPHHSGPIGLNLTGRGYRRRTHEVRIPDRVFVRGSHLQAVFAPKARVAADLEIEALFQWCAVEGVDSIPLDTPRASDFEALRKACLDYIRRKLC